MKKYLFLMLTGVSMLMSCGNDDPIPQVIPELGKLTKISCYKNGAPMPEYSAEVYYTQQGEIDRIVEGSGTTSPLVFKDDQILVIRDGFIQTIYSLSNQSIVKKEERAMNASANDETYVNNEYVYRYDRLNLLSVSWTARWPKTDGKGYEERVYDRVDTYSWQDGNAVRYSHIPNEEMVYEYTTQLRPLNFPFRVVNTLRPVGLESLSPLNFRYGNMNRNLPMRAYWYNVPEVSTLCDEYLFSYTFAGDYIAAMQITEKKPARKDEPAEENKYTYTFEYTK